MTQLVQLQQVAAELADNGFSVFAISNDPVDVLADFAAEHSINYPLLSDVDSAVIRSFGIMNQLIEPDEGKGMRWYGIPYPGTYFLDSSGQVADKDFHQHHARRASGVSVLARALGRPIEAEPATQVAAEANDLAISVALSDPALQLELISQIIVELDVPEGRHLYAPDAPEQFTPLSIEISAPGDRGLRVGEPEWPHSSPLTMDELNLTAPTYAGRVRISIPITTTSEIARLGHEIEDAIDLTISLRFQLCDSTTCDIPRAVELPLRVPLERLVEPDGLAIYAQRVDAAEAERNGPVR